MKLLRCGNVGKEIPAVLDKNGIIRNLSKIIPDLTPNTLSKSTIEKIKKKDLSKLPEIKGNPRIGPCVFKPEKFIGIGLNYSSHAKETNASTPKEPIVFFKACSSICGPNDNVYLPKGSLKSDWEVELGASTRIFDRATGKIHYGKVPAYSVVVPGAMPSKNNPDGPQLYCVVIVKKVDEKTRSKTSINDLLRD